MHLQTFVQLGWTPILAIVNDGTRRVLQVVGWDGGSGTVPATGLYIGSTGYVSLIASGVDISATAGTIINFSDGETPSGLKNASNLIFSLSFSPLANSLKVYLNGQKLSKTNDFTFTGTTLTMVSAPFPTDTLEVDYRY